MSLFARRFLHNQFPTKVNLYRHEILNSTYQLCFDGLGIEEDLNLLLFEYAMSRKVWFAILYWFGVSRALTNGVSHFNQFCGLQAPNQNKMIFI